MLAFSAVNCIHSTAAPPEPVLPCIFFFFLGGGCAWRKQQWSWEARPCPSRSSWSPKQAETKDKRQNFQPWDRQVERCKVVHGASRMPPALQMASQGLLTLVPWAKCYGSHFTLGETETQRGKAPLSEISDVNSDLPVLTSSCWSLHFWRGS